MLKIGLYQNICVGLSVICMNHNTYDYRKEQSYTTGRPATSAIHKRFSPRQEPLIPYALSRYLIEGSRTELQRSRDTNRDDTYIREFMGEASRGRRNQKPGDSTGTWPQANNGLLG